MDFPPGVTTMTTVTSSNSSVAYGTPVTFTATVAAQSGSIAPAVGSVDFYDTTTKTDLGLGTFGRSTGMTSIWTLATGAKTLNAAAGDTITAAYADETGFADSSGTTTQTVTAIELRSPRPPAPRFTTARRIRRPCPRSAPGAW